MANTQLKLLAPNSTLLYLAKKQKRQVCTCLFLLLPLAGDSPVRGNVDFRSTKGLPSPAKESNRRFDSRYGSNAKRSTDLLSMLLFDGAAGRSRTGTVSLPLDFESSASANSTTAASLNSLIIIYEYHKKSKRFSIKK